MRVILFGGTDLTRAVAEHVLRHDLELVGVVTVPRRFSISYRREGVDNVRYGDMSSWGAGHAIPTHEHADLDETISFCERVRGEFALVAGWYHMLPRKLRNVFPIGCAAIHASLLPRFRGGAPLNWAILLGETETGVSMFRLEDEVDAGPLYGQKAFPIGPRATIRDLVLAAEAASIDLLDDVLPKLLEDACELRPQTGKPSYSLMRFPEDGAIDWSQPARAIDRLIRAVTRPYPGAFTVKGGRYVWIWEAEPAPHDVVIHGAPGQIARLPDDIDPYVVTGAGALLLRDVTDEDGTSILPELRRAAHQRFDAVVGALPRRLAGVGP